MPKVSKKQKNIQKTEMKETKKNVQATNSAHLMTGRVVAAKQAKTVSVLVERKKMHPFYKKAFKRSSKYLVHDEIGVVEGDIVEIKKIRPISKNKHWGVVRVVGKDIEAIVTEQLKEDAAQEIAEVMPVEVEEEVKEKAEEEEKQIKAKKEKRKAKK